VISFRRLGPRRFPAVTLTVSAVTASINALQFAVRGTLQHLERTPAGLHGDWWRTFTSLFVQDGGAAGTAFNLTLLLVVGVLAEQVVSRPQWLLQYFGVGLAVELLAYSWQPTGGGNSIAVFGLAGAVVVALWLGDPALPWFAGPANRRINAAFIVAAGLVLAGLENIHGAAILLGVAFAALARWRRPASNAE
jgi:membrane associated rhomboid family serine protease